MASLSYAKSKSGPWTALPRRDDNYFVATGIAKPVFFKVTSTSGKAVIDANIAPLEQGGVVSSSGQF